ncbi:extracellular calcium-sensing receptor-like [Pyxicephalus adspersus]|uniref:extracellular calcium-sensing receptor-like n=1 Tax=Pyxicephalus adspersus TaxID=30357 RepID=UPI003B594D5F
MNPINIEVWKTILIHFISVIYCVDPKCRLSPVMELEGVTLPGDIMIGLLLPVHIDKIQQKVTFQVEPPRTTCTWFDLSIYQYLKTAFYTAEETNQNQNILPNITLGFQMYDTCNVPHYELQGALRFLTEPYRVPSNSPCNSSSFFSAVIGSRVSVNSIILANVLGAFRYPQVSPFSTLSLLSNRKLFPSFFRSCSSDKLQSRGLARLIQYFGWTWVGFLASYNDYGIQGIQPIKEEIVKAGACVAFTEYIHLDLPDGNAPNIVRTIKGSKANVVIVFAYETDFVLVVKELLNQNVTGKTFVGNAGWSRSLLLSLNSYFPVLSGTLGFTSNNEMASVFNEFLTKIPPVLSVKEDWMKMYWEDVFNCRFVNHSNLNDSLGLSIKSCTGDEKLESAKNSSTYTNSLKYAYQMYFSFFIVAQALEDLNSCKMGEGPFSQMSCTTIWNFKPWQLTYYIRNVRIPSIYGKEIVFDENGDLPTFYSIVNWQVSPQGFINYVKIGIFNTSAPPDQAVTINSSLVLWPGGSQQVPHSVCSQTCSSGFWKASVSGKPLCCFDCVPCLQGEISNQSGSALCIKCPWDQWPNDQRSSCVPKPMEFLSYKEMLGASLAAVSIKSAFLPVYILWIFISYNDTPIVKANNYSLSCLLLISLCLCFFCSLGFIGYPQPEKCLLRQVSFGLVFTLSVACVLAKTIMVVFAFMATKPRSRLKKWTTFRVSYSIIFVCLFLQSILCFVWLFLAPPFSQYNLATKSGVIIVECNEGSSVAFWTMLGYLFLLASMSLMVAFLARRLPDSFNEAQFITFSMLAFLSVWISYMPASFSAQGKYTVAVEIFAILASSWALMICMFLPKCFIILFRPDMNSRVYLLNNNAAKKPKIWTSA